MKPTEEQLTTRSDTPRIRRSFQYRISPDVFLLNFQTIFLTFVFMPSLTSMINNNNNTV